MTRNGTASPLRPSAPRTRGTVSGSSRTPRYPTPTKIDATTTAIRKADTKGRHSLGLAHLANAGVLDLSDPVAMHGELLRRIDAGRLPTPQGRLNGKARGSGMRGRGSLERGGGMQLENLVGGPLNPTWIEWLMGFPLGWTELPR